MFVYSVIYILLGFFVLCYIVKYYVWDVNYREVKSVSLLNRKIFLFGRKYD